MAIGSVSPPLPPTETDAPRTTAPPASSAPPRAGLPAATGSPPARKRRSAALRRRIGLLPALVLGALVLLVWQLAAATGAVNAYLLPPPADVLRSFWQSVTDGLLWSYAQTTIVESIAGFVLGTAVALPLGYAVARSRTLARVLEPYIAASQAMPAVALAPLLVLWIGYGTPPVVVLCALIVFFPTVVTTVLGLRTLDHDVLDAARVDGASRWTLLRHIEAPLALPSVLAGTRASLTYSITGAIVGEFVIGDQGLGGLLNVARGNFDPPLMYATLLTLMLLAAVMYGIGRLAERRLSYLEA
ncbi:MAG TPA: ABC transporter permease [Ktedonobacterales bacterium]|nr:ABC transporter permease [Ktedonobacterales bacterium]